MTFNSAVNQATKHLVRSKAARTIHEFTLDIEQTEWNTLLVTTWGWDHAQIEIPTDRPSMIGRKCRLQMRSRDQLDEIELRYIFDILRRESN